ncbi:MAG TPA: hypothetical protein PKY06_21465, partial [Saprospiraceae bacterium]|nr:hypothetical protein [Saprospiraceae bacterium]
NQTTDPNHQQLGISTDCATCHTTDPGWSPAQFPIHDQIYVLRGAHAAIANDCASCHTSGYANTPNTCVGCHLDNFNQTTSPNHQQSGFGTDCASCHSEDAWIPASLTNFDHNTTNFPLTGAHTSVACVDCHTNGYSGTSKECVSCHQSDFNRSVDPNHQAVGISTECATCHTTNPGWSPAQFPIHDQIYALNGAHAQIANDCAQCHSNGYSNTPSTCYGCHSSNYIQTTNPNHQANAFSTACATCHSEDAWIPANFNGNFDHSQTNFPLTGAHTNVACIDCHSNGYAGTPMECVSCHQDNFNQTIDPNHQQLGISSDCASCHTTDPGWSPASFPIHNQIYELKGAHASIANDCAACHANGYANTPNTCVGCHLDNYNQTTDPNHTSVGFSTDCASCHMEDAWQPALPIGFDHSTTNFPLTGAHTSVACVDCHVNGYSGTPMECVSCHLDNFNQTTDPNHQQLGISTDCATCHTTDPGWNPASFPIHDQIYVLRGAHALIANDCAQCHSNGYANTPNTCAGCHQSDFNQTTDPNHRTYGFSNDCASCHSEDAWTPVNFTGNFNHSITGFTLTGAHIDAACIDCHANGYSGTPTTCVSCHQVDFNQATNPNHQQLSLGNNCATCHTTDPGWSPAQFPNHNDFYVLNGAHALIANDCATCHNGNYTNTPNTCVGCHQDNYNQTTNPNHQQLGFGTECAACHSEDAWRPANLENFDHNQTNFPLTGAHVSVACQSCHAGGYAGTPMNCSSCHLPDYNGSSNPNHRNLGLSTDCATCHTTEPGWSPAQFPVHDQYYVLQGAHAAIANNCAQCHNGTYANTPNTCIGCHTSDYNQTTNPNHQNNNFPTDCEACHTQNAWTPATFDHDAQYFPIYSGKHRQGQAWNLCSECHINANNYAIFTCIQCHEHSNKTDLDDKHRGIRNYAYTATSCFDCHPRGTK